ncbi:hypothetical protein GW17_00037563 [Ensete ventricosum]|nr:hypothetical protein GW17_00037563 [Ensete ventricosum]
MICLFRLVLSCFQILLIQDGKLCGKDSFHDVISRALALPELTADKEFQKNEFIVQLGQVRIEFTSKYLARVPSSPACRRRPQVARGHGRFFFRARRRSVSPRGEKDRGDKVIIDTLCTVPVPANMPCSVYQVSVGMVNTSQTIPYCIRLYCIPCNQGLKSSSYSYASTCCSTKKRGGGKGGDQEDEEYRVGG